MIVLVPFFLSHVVTAQPFNTTTGYSLTVGADEADPPVVPGVVVVRLGQHLVLGKHATATGMSSVDVLLKTLGAVQVEPFLKNEWLGKRDLVTSSLEGVYRITYSANMDPRRVAEFLSENPDIVYAEPLYMHTLFETPNDQSFANMDQFVRVEAEAAWDVVKTDGNVVIAIVDGGTDWNHPDLVENVWTNSSEIPGNGLDDDENGYTDDVHGWNFPLDAPDPTGMANTPKNAAHGTHVAGTAAARTNNSLGVASLSWNARFMPINVGSLLSDDNLTFGYEGITYATANGAEIINCSWGRPGGGSRFEEDVINFAYDNGALVVAAAGNETDNLDLVPHFPAAYRQVLAVGATGKSDDNVAVFSNFGVSVDVYAPGVSILSTIPNSLYSGFYSGTSMASPMAAALAALVKARWPSLSVDALREQIRMTGDIVASAEPSRRINARRAVTESGSPAVRFVEATVIDANSDGIISPGETVDVQVTLANYLYDSPPLTVGLSTNDTYTTVLVSEQSLGAIPAGQTAVTSFRFVVSTQIPIHHSIRLFVDLNGLEYDDRDVFTLVANPSKVLDHDTGKIQTSITSEGNIGSLGFVGEEPGLGFIVDGTNYLFEGGLMIGTGVQTVSDAIRGLDSIQDRDFKPAFGSDLAILSPGLHAHEEGSIVLVDSLAAIPIGLTIRQQSFADTAAENQEFVIFKYTIRNDNASPVTNLYAGLFFDWDISDQSADNWSYDAERKMGIVSEAKSPVTKLAATRLLTSTSDVSFKAIDNAAEIYDGFSDQEKWSFLSGGIQTESLQRTDVSQLTSEGPFTLAPGDSVQVAFAVIGATTEEALIASADEALVFFDRLTTATEPMPQLPIQTARLNAPFPNPFRGSTTVYFTLPTPENVTLSVYDVLGRRVARLVHELLPPGTHEIVWDGLSEGQQHLAAGLYFLRMSTASTIQTQSLILTR